MFPNPFSISEDEESSPPGDDAADGTGESGAAGADFKKPITTKSMTEAAKKYIKN